MPDIATTFATLQQDAPNVWIARQQYRLAEKRLIVGRAATKFNLPQRSSKTLRVTRHKRLALPTATLTEGTPPDAVSLAVETVDVTVEQWGITVLLTDVALITTEHPALQIAIDRTALAMAEVLEREMCVMLMGGTNVFYPGSVTSRAGLSSANKMDTATVLKATVDLANTGAAPFEGALYMGVMPPQVVGDLTASDQTFKDASNFANVRKLEYAEIGVWGRVRWSESNFLPIFKGQGTPDTSAASGSLSGGNCKPQVVVNSTGGSLPASTNFKIAVVWRDKNTDYERHITQTSANISTAASAGGSVQVTVPTSTLTNYVYDVYMTQAGGTSPLYRVLSRQSTATSAAITSFPTGSEPVLPAAPAPGVEVFVSWVFGKDAFGRVELDGMSLQSYITPAGASWSNPLAQGRKVGSKVMWKSFLIDGAFMARIETGSAFSAGLPAG